MFAEYLLPYIKSPLFAVQSLYDSWSLPNITGIACITHTGSMSRCSTSDMKVIEEYRTRQLAFLNKLTEDKRDGAWAPACAFHGFLHQNTTNSPKYRVPVGS